jgi:hypothetical protein
MPLRAPPMLSEVTTGFMAESLWRGLARRGGSQPYPG